MDCRTARMLLPYAARPAELGPEDTADLSAHLAACADCGALARSEKSFDDAIGRAMIAVPVPDGLLGNINNRLRRSRRRKHLLRMGTAAAAVFLVTVTAAVWGTHKIEVHPEAL